MSLHLLCAVALMAVSEPVPTSTSGRSRSRTDPAARDGEPAPGLVSAARDGDAEAFAELYAEHRATVYRLLLARTRSTTLADDLTSETFCRAWGAMSQFRLHEQYFGAWLLRIARNLTVDHFRSRARALELSTADLSHLETDAVAGPDEALLPGVHSDELKVALSLLPPDQRRCLTLRYFDGLSIVTTAEILGRSQGAVKQLQWRGLRNLSKSLAHLTRPAMTARVVLVVDEGKPH